MTQLGKYMTELCGNNVPWRVLQVEAHDFPTGTLLFEVHVGPEGMYKQTFITIAPLRHNGLHAVKTYPDSSLTAMGLTMEGALYNAISRSLQEKASWL